MFKSTILASGDTYRRVLPQAPYDTRQQGGNPQHKLESRDAKIGRVLLRSGLTMGDDGFVA